MQAHSALNAPAGISRARDGSRPPAPVRLLVRAIRRTCRTLSLSTETGRCWWIFWQAPLSWPNLAFRRVGRIPWEALPRAEPSLALSGASASEQRWPLLLCSGADGPSVHAVQEQRLEA